MPAIRSFSGHIVTTSTPPELRGHRALWHVASPLPDDLRGALRSSSPMLAHLLYCRGYRTAEAIDAFFLGGPVRHDPLSMPDMKRAVERIGQAVENGERVAVYGDFDCDGLTATAILEGAFRDLGLDAVVHIPHRDDGHGLQPEALIRLADAGVTLIVTGDCGIAAVSEIQVALGLGIDIIVTDHHEPHADGSLPDCPVVAPTRQDSLYPCRFLCGAGVAFKLVEALAARFPGRIAPDSYLDLVALGTVADVVPLRDENRSFVVRGLSALQRTSRPGLRALFRAAGVDAERIDPVSIGFYLAPRINAANRMASPQLAYDLISADDEARAADLAIQLGRHNEERRRLVERHTEELFQLLGPVASVTHRVMSGVSPPILLVRGDWPPGISGLLATRLVETYGLPAFVGTAAADNTVAVSGRGTPGVHLDELLERAESSVPGGLFLGHGGHSRAGGFRIRAERWEEARAILSHEARAAVDTAVLGNELHIDADIGLARLTLDAAERIRSLAPFGMEFDEPLFLTRSVTVQSVSPMGNGTHARLALRQGDAWMRAVYFRADTELLHLRPGTVIDAVYHVTLDEWNGQRRVQMRIRDWRLTGPGQA